MDWHKQRERHVEQRQQNSWQMHSHWYKHNVPQCQPRHSNSNHHSKHRPPTFLRLNSQGHEEFPNCSEFSERLPSSSRNQGQQQRAHSFLGSIFSKASHSFTASGTTHHLAKNSARGLQGEINLDTLADKFTTDLSVEPTNKMMNQEMPRCPPRQAHPVRPSMMNFNGGPYITLTSQNNSLKTFPACYRFLNLVHFHPYSNANRYNRAMPPPFGQGRPAWSAGGTLQSRYHNKYPDFDHHTMKVPLVGHCKTPESRPQRNCLSAHHGNKASADMMQVGHCMSHQSSQHIKSNVNKVASSKPLQIETKSDSFHDGSKTTAANCSPPHSDDGRQSQPCARPSPTCAEFTKDMPKRQPTCSPNSGSSSEQTLRDSDVAKPNMTTETQDLNVCSPCSPVDNSDNVNKIDNITKCNNEANEKDKKHKNLLNQKSTSNSAPTSDKELHSSIAYLLGNYSTESASGSYDSDFSDADEDTLNEEINCENQELLESFLTNDVYNPLDGWKCNGNLTSIKTQTDIIAEININNTKFNDSGVSVQTLDDAASNNESDSSGDWSDSGCDEEDGDEEEQKLWDSLNACDDPYDPLQGWRCNQPPLQNIDERDSLAENRTKSLLQTVEHDSKNSLQKTVAHNNTCSTDSIQQAVAHNSTDSLEQTVVTTISADSLQEMVGHDETDSPQQTVSHDSTGLPQQLASNPLETARHPSVSFILGGDDYESSSDSDTDETSQLQDELWNSFEATDDPYDPINGWRYHSPSPIHKSSSSPSLLCTDKQSTCSEKTQSVLEAKCALLEPEDSDCKNSTAATGVFLKCSSSTGCLMMWRSTLKVSEKKPKKVTFCNKEPSTIFSQQVPEWGEEEYAQARRGHWQDFARDRCRFQKRIRDAEAAIALYLTSAHRMKVFETLYSNQ